MNDPQTDKNASPVDHPGRDVRPYSGLPPVVVERVNRRHLPHWQRAGATYFLTWRCAQGVILTDGERDVVLSSIRHWDGVHWEVFAAVVMPDHVHVLTCPNEKNGGRWDLAELLHSVKSFSAHEIAKRRPSTVVLGNSAATSAESRSIWQDERYDRWVRDEAEFLEKLTYIINNPVMSGLVDSPVHYRWLYQKWTE